MELEERFYLIQLFEIYSPILTTRQQEYFQQSYLEDKSLSEIADIFNVSRVNVHNTIKNICRELLKLEKSLHLHEKSKYRIKLYEQISDQSLRDQLLELEFNKNDKK